MLREYEVIIIVSYNTLVVIVTKPIQTIFFIAGDVQGSILANRRAISHRRVYCIIKYALVGG